VAWSLIAHAANSNGATAAIDTTGADIIFLATATFGAQTPTDSASNTWTGLTAKAGGDSNNLRLWYCKNPVTSATHTFNTASFYSIAVQAWSGSGATPFDVENGATGSSLNSLATGSITPSEDDELIISAFGVNTSTSGRTWSVNSSLTISDQRGSNSSGTNFGLGFAYLNQATAASINPTWTISGGATSTVEAVIASFKGAGGGGGGGVSTTVGAVSAAASVTGTGRSFAHVVGVSSAIASVAGVGANANAGERETVGISTGQASVVGVGGKDHFSTGTAAGVASVTGVGQSEVLTVGNSAGVATVVGVGEAVIAGQAVGTASGIATVSGVASSIAEAVGTSSGASDASGVNPQVVVTQRLVVGAGGELSWEDHVKAIHEMRMLEGRVRKQKKELQKVVKQIKVVEKQYKQEKTEGILANLYKLEMKKEEIETKIEALEVDLEPLIMAIDKWEIEEDDQEFMMMQ
jgi:hypothetical protein